MNIITVVDWIVARIKEPSTWRGIASVAGLVGLHLAPEQWESITTATISIIAAIEIFRKEKPAA